jgi:hypothetical protein
MRPTFVFAAIIVTTTIALAVVRPAFAHDGGGKGLSPSNEQYGSYSAPPGFNNFGDREGWNNGSTPPGWKRGKKAGWRGAKTPPGRLGRARRGSRQDEDDD